MVACHLSSLSHCTSRDTTYLNYHDSDCDELVQFSSIVLRYEMCVRLKSFGVNTVNSSSLLNSFRNFVSSQIWRQSVELFKSVSTSFDFCQTAIICFVIYLFVNFNAVSNFMTICQVGKQLQRYFEISNVAWISTSWVNVGKF